MKNLYLRLFVAQTKLMTAEKMQLDRYCQYGEYLAYKIALPPTPARGPNDVNFIFSADLETMQYRFTNDYIDEPEFEAFEAHLSTYLNKLFERKQEVDRNNQEFQDLMQKIGEEWTEEQRRCLAVNIDANTDAILKSLGVKTTKI